VEININEQSKIVEIWLTNAEKQNAALRERLRPLYRQCKAQGYLTAVFESGERDLTAATSDLLCHNRKRIAQLEVEREKQSRLSI